MLKELQQEEDSDADEESGDSQLIHDSSTRHGLWTRYNHVNVR